MKKIDMGIFFRMHHLLTRGHRHHKHLCLSQIKALIYLIKHNACTISDIKNHLKLAKSSTTALIEVLLRKGLIIKTTDKNDRRKTIIELTALGSNTAKETMENMHKTISKNIKKLNQQDIKDLESVQQVLKRICNKLEATE